MTIDEAIENLKYDNEIDMYIRDIAPQLAEWLEELKARREADRISDIKPFDVLLVQRYNNAIDDFVNAIDERDREEPFVESIWVIEEIAEQLKAGGSNERM